MDKLDTAHKRVRSRLLRIVGENITMKVALLTDTAKLPSRKNPTDAGLDVYVDLYSFSIASMEVVYPGETKIFHTGVTVEIPTNCFGWITNKSKNDFLIGGGIVDPGYQGELLVKVINPGDDNILITHHDAIAQLLIMPCHSLEIELVDKDVIHKDKSTRGKDGGIARQLSLGGF